MLWMVKSAYVIYEWSLRREEDAARAVADLNNRWFGGRPIYAELSPVTDFREACCRKSSIFNRVVLNNEHTFNDSVNCP